MLLFSLKMRTRELPFIEDGQKTNKQVTMGLVSPCLYSEAHLHNVIFSLKLCGDIIPSKTDQHHYFF